MTNPATPTPTAASGPGFFPISRVLRLFGWLALAGMLGVVLLVVVIANTDWNGKRAWIGERGSSMLNRPFSINGDLAVEWIRVRDGSGKQSWFPWPHVFAHDVVLGNVEWSSEPQMIKVDEVALAISPWPLLARTVSVPAMRLTGTDVRVERRADGRNNWTFDLAGGGTWNVEFGDLVLEQGKITIVDAIERAELVIEVTPLKAPIGFDDVMRSAESELRAESAQTIGENAARKFRDAAARPDSARSGVRRSSRAYEFAWTANGTFRNAPIEGRGRSGGIFDMHDAEDPFPLQARFRSGTTRIAFVGTLTKPTDLAAIDLRMWVSGKSMSDLYALGRVALPDTPPFATEGRLKGEIKRGSSVYRYESFTGRVGGSDLGGSLVWTERSPRPILTGSVKSQLLQIADLGPLIGAGEGASVAKGETPDDARVIPNARFRTDRWNAMDADVAFSGGRIVHAAKEWPIEAVETRIALDNGFLRLEPLRFGVAGGRVVSAIRLDGSKKPLRGEIDIDARKLELEQLLPVPEGQATFGQINAKVDLVGTGDSVAAVLGSSDGKVGLLIDEGSISKTLLETAGLNLGNVIIARLFGDREVKINCAASHFVATDGDLVAEAFLIDTDDALIDVSGHVDLGNERMDMTVRPQSKGLRVLSLRSPLYVKGTFRDPDIGVKKGPLIARGAGAILLAAFAAPAAALIPLISPSKRGEPGRCEALLADMRRGDSPAPAASSGPAAKGK